MVGREGRGRACVEVLRSACDDREEDACSTSHYNEDLHLNETFPGKSNSRTRKSRIEKCTMQPTMMKSLWPEPLTTLL